MAQVDVENGDDENGNMRSFNVIYSSRHDLIIKLFISDNFDEKSEAYNKAHDEVQSLTGSKGRPSVKLL